MDSYITLLKEGKGEYEEKHSRFLASAVPCTSEEEAARLLAERKSLMWDAKHTVYAYVLKNKTAKFSDDKEPHGTAGKPILDIINGSNITDVMVMVTRYFGGVLLGTGGLVRAYSSAARIALDNAEKGKMCPCSVYEISCGYSQYERLLSLSKSVDFQITDTEFADCVKITVLLLEENAEEFLRTIKDAFSSAVVAKFVENRYSAIKIEI